MARKKRRKKRVNEKTLLVTADIGKNAHHVYFVTPDGKEVMPFPVPNNRDGFDSLWEKIVNFRDANCLESVLFGFESSGPYAAPLTHFMDARGAEITQINPMHTKKMKEVIDNSPEKSDRKGPLVIACIIKMGSGLNVIIPRGHAADLRRLAQAREHIMGLRKRLYCKIHECLAIVFPEYDILDVKTKTAAWLFKNHATPRRIAELGEDGLLKNLKMVSHGNMKTDKIKKLYAAAINSVGVQEGLIGFEIELKHLYEQVESADRSIVEIEGKMAEILGKIPCSRYLLSIHGIGTVIASILIGEIGDFQMFRNAQELIKLAGLNLYSVSSGKHVGKIKITKRGRGLLRKTLYFAVLSMVRSGGFFHERYKKYLDAGKPPKSALTILARKLLVIVFALVRNETCFEPKQVVLNKRAA
jgi:transposase